MLARALFLILLTLPTLVHANNTWTCVTSADLSGDASYYWAHGRDSWTGNGLIECTSGRRVLRLKTLVRYEGRDPGMGASINSRLAFESMPIVTRVPDSLAQKMTVSQNGDTEAWVSSGSDVALNFLLFGNQLRRFAGSMRAGDLDILVHSRQTK